jgi:heme-degrading monooxygenase HmoA
MLGCPVLRRWSERRQRIAVKVLIERKIRPGLEGAAWDILQELRTRAVKTRGYLHGESWRSVDDPTVFMVLSVWATLEDWRRWTDDEERLSMHRALAAILEAPVSVRAFEDATDPRFAQEYSRESVIHISQ